MCPGNREPEEGNDLFSRISVPGVIPPGAHIHIQRVGYAQTVQLCHEIVESDHPDGIDDAEIPVQLGQRPVAPDPGTIDPHDGLSVPDQTELHESAAARFRSFPDRPGRIVEFEGITAFRKGKRRETVLVVRAFIEDVVHCMVPVDIHMGEAEADIAGRGGKDREGAEAVR